MGRPSPAVAAEAAHILAPALRAFREARANDPDLVIAADTPTEPQPVGAASAAITAPGSTSARPPVGSGATSP